VTTTDPSLTRVQVMRAGRHADAKPCINGNEWAKRQAAKAGIDTSRWDNGSASCGGAGEVGAEL
jgi:hypothetical protein